MQPGMQGSLAQWATSSPLTPPIMPILLLYAAHVYPTGNLCSNGRYFSRCAVRRGHPQFLLRYTDRCPAVPCSPLITVREGSPQRFQPCHAQSILELSRGCVANQVDPHRSKPRARWRYSLLRPPCRTGHSLPARSRACCVPPAARTRLFTPYFGALTVQANLAN